MVSSGVKTDFRTRDRHAIPGYDEVNLKSEGRIDAQHAKRANPQHESTHGFITPSGDQSGERWALGL
jgi:hypothetical protein